VTIPLFRTVWEDEHRYYQPDFVAYVDRKLEEAPAAGTVAGTPTS
jgi:hypothetical protein